jgi:hypothetical protein
MRDYVWWNRKVSAAFTPLAGQIEGLEIIYYEDTDTLSEVPLVVLGVMVTVMDQYARLKKSEHDHGEPKRPPTAP